MKTSTKYLLTAIVGLGVISKEAYSNPTSLDDRIHTRTVEHMQNIDDLTMSNLFLNKAKIENLCKAILAILNENSFVNSKPQLKRALEANNITHLKQIIAELPEQTQKVIIAKIKDDRIKNFLGLS
ncbi:MAG: hypothetical protein CL947_04065 [Epsilonproteobacteria bacterium]|nr:hypothetical protein [Campylobacterota bacterium]|tara:strand:- start:7848 stop:8225 length:378 start_codon:yes stop_codon:yes gene_type:complete